MITVKNPNQLYIFDPWEFLTPKRRQMLDAGWPGLFKETILPTLPINKLSKYFDSVWGRPSKELYAMLGALILQQTFDLTDEETVQQFCFNIQWHYALNITEESDAAKYMSAKTLWNNRNIVASNNLEEDVFDNGTKELPKVFGVDIEKQRLNSVHIKSNMCRLGRIGIFSESVHKFLINLKRNHQNQFEAIDKILIDRYLSKEALGCFARVKPSESRKTLCQVAKDLFDLVQQFKSCEQISDMYTYRLLERVLKEQCKLTSDKDNPVELKNPKEIVPDSLQNPSDPDATYSGHKGQGYQIQVMETYCSDENTEHAKQHGVELIAPTMGAVDQDKLSLADFQFTEKGEVTACPEGYGPDRVKKRNTICIGFSAHHCQNCPHLSICPVKKSKKLYYLNFTDKQVRIARRRVYEQSDSFKDRNRWRAGVEATMSEYDRRTGVKHLRVRDLKAVRFCATLKALAENILRATAARVAAMMPEKEFCTV